jgi:AcrR family transcriptional regulator
MPSRRQPVQARAVRRREALLDATARLIERAGLDGLTTTAIAEEASASVGTVYSYFRDRDAMLHALLERYRTRLDQAMGHALSDQREVSLDMVDRAADAFVDFYRSEPGYRALWLGSQHLPTLQETGHAWGAAYTQAIAALLSLRGVPPERGRVVATTAIYLLSSLVTLALSRPEDEDALIEEARVALRRYLAPVFE